MIIMIIIIRFTLQWKTCYFSFLFVNNKNKKTVKNPGNSKK